MATAVPPCKVAAPAMRCLRTRFSLRRQGPQVYGTEDHRHRAAIGDRLQQAVVQISHDSSVMECKNTRRLSPRGRSRLDFTGIYSSLSHADLRPDQFSNRRERSPLLALVSVRQRTGSPIDVCSGAPRSPGLCHPQTGTAPRRRTDPPSRFGNTPGILADIGSIWYRGWSQNRGFRIAYRAYSLCSSGSSCHRGAQIAGHC